MSARARAILEGTDVAVGTTIGFPHGNHLTETKVFEVGAGARRRRDRARHGHPDRRAQVRSRRRGPGRHRRGRRRRPRGRRDRQGHLRERLPDRRREDPGLPPRPRPPAPTSSRPRPGSPRAARPTTTCSSCAPTRRRTSQVKAAGGVRTLDALLEVMALGVDAGSVPRRRRRSSTTSGRARPGEDRVAAGAILGGGWRATDGRPSRRPPSAGCSTGCRSDGRCSSASPRPRATPSRPPASGAPTRSRPTASSTCSGPDTRASRSRRCSRATARTPASTRWSSCR